MTISVRSVWVKILKINPSHLSPGHPLKLEWKRSIISFSYAIITLFIGAFMLVISDNHYKPQPALYDRILNHIPDYTPLSTIANAMTQSQIATTFVFTMLLPRPWNVIVIRRIFILLGTLFFTRGIFIVMTTVPSPIGIACVPAKARGIKALLVLFELSIGAHSDCTDNIFSGHTATVLTACLQIHFYSRHKFLIILCWLNSLCAISLVLISRMHYTVDILCAMVICCLMHLLFMVGCQSDSKYFLIKMIKFLDGVDIRNKYHNITASIESLKSNNNVPVTVRESRLGSIN